MSPEEILAVLANTALATGLTGTELAPLLATAEVQTVAPGQVVIAEGHSGDTLYVVLQGRLNVVLRADSETHPSRVTDIHLNTLQPGDCFGEYSLIDAKPASASVVALDPSVLLTLTRTAFDQVAAAHDKLAKMIYRNLLGILIRRLRKKDRELDLDFEV